MAVAITASRAHDSTMESKGRAGSAIQRSSTSKFYTVGNLQLQDALSESALRTNRNIDSPDEPVQPKLAQPEAVPVTHSDPAKTLVRNARRPAVTLGRDSTKPGIGFNLVGTHIEHDSAVPPVQTKCADCEAEQASAEEEPIQLWDCSEFIEPSCVQTQEAAGESPVQTKCAECEAEEADEQKEAVQTQCTACEAEDKNTEQEPIQLWDCTEFTEPTCVQTQEAADGKVQQALDAGPARTPARIHREARRGLRDAAQPLPHGEKIQAAFGHHDISHVRTSLGGAAEAANRRMGALAFASGHRIAFRQSPDLHLAAHEAAHVVQQREGLRLPGAVGRAGDRWERHADRVADAVVKGQSAQPLLDEVARPTRGDARATPGGVVQHRFTSSPAHLTEAPPRAPAAAPAANQGKDKAKSAGAPGAAGTQTETGGALEAAGAGAGSEAPPEGITVGGAPAAAAGGDMSAAAGGAGAPAGAGAATPGAAPGAAGGAAASAAGGGGGGINAPCYNVDPPPVPEETEEPSSDERSAESEAEPQVTFDAWVDEPDQCPAETQLQQGAQQMPEGIGAAAPAAPAAAGARPAGAAPKTAGGGPPAMAEAAPASGEGGTESAGSSVGGAESARDGAVADFESATGPLDAVLSRANSLEQGTSFAPGGADTQRDQAIDQVRAFMRRTGAQITGAVAFAREQVPARLGGMAEAAMASLQSGIASEKAAISGRIAQARMQARVAAQRARAHVHAEYAVSIATVVAETSSALATLSTQHTSAVEQVDQQETQALEDVNRRFATGRTRHEDKGPEYARRAIARGQEHASQYERCKGDYSDDGFWDGCLTVRRAKAQQDAACKTAAGYKTTFLRTANKKGYDLLPLRTQYRCAVIAGARQVGQTLDDTYDKLEAGLEQGQTQAIEGLGSARTQNLAAIDKALNATLRALAAQEHTQRQAVNDSGYSAQLGIEQLAHASAANLARGVGAAMDSLDRALSDLRTRLAGGAVPPPDALARTLAEIEASLGGGMGSFLATMETGAATAQAQIGQAASAGLGGLAGISAQNAAQSAQAEADFTGTMNGLMAGASSAFAQLTGNHVDQARKSATEGTTAMKQAVAGFVESLGTIRERVDGAIDTSLQGLDGELSGKLAELDGQIAREAWKAAEKEQPAWKKVVAIVLIIVVIIAAAVISIVTLGAGASLFAVILVGALVGAVSAGLIQILNNWASGETWHEGLVQAMVMGAIGGAIGGGLGLAGGALAAGAAVAGARVATQLAITVTSDLVAEGLTQTIGFFAFGQQFNWQGFVMAGAMSGLSFRAHPSPPHPPAAHAPAPRAAAPHAPAPHAGAPHAEAPHVAAPHAEAPGPAPRGATPEAPPVPHPSAPEATTPRPAAPETVAPRTPSPTAAGVAAARRGAVSQLAGGALVGLGVEVAASVITGEKLDATRIASAAASAAVAARMSRLGDVPGTRREPTTRLGHAAERVRDRVSAAFEPTTRAGRALDRFRSFDPGGVGARLGERLKGFGGRMVGAPPEAEIPGGVRPRTEEEASRLVDEIEATPARTTEDQTSTRPSQEVTPPRASTEGEPSRTTPRSEAELEVNAARSRSGSRPDADLDLPAKMVSDSDLALTTTNSTRVGNVEHYNAIRKPAGRAECEVCSFGCGRIKNRIDEIEARLREINPDHPLIEGLQSLREQVTRVESGIENASISHRDAVNESAQIAQRFRDLGQLEPRLGEALSHPSRIVPESGAPHGRISMEDLGVDVDTRQVKSIDNYDQLDIPPGTPVLYVLRNPETGAVMKVGQTTMGSGSDARFGRYERAGSELGIRLELEVTPITNLRGQSIETPEGHLRAALEDQGHVMPWDYTKPHLYRDVGGAGARGRLGREGPGTPFEQLPGSKTSRLRREGYDWERVDPTRKGYLMSPHGHSGLQPRTPFDETVEVLRNTQQYPTRQAQADALGIPLKTLESRITEWRSDLEDAGITFRR